jgi:hypothetical protein
MARLRLPSSIARAPRHEDGYNDYRRVRASRRRHASAGARLAALGSGGGGPDARRGRGRRHAAGAAALLSLSPSPGTHVVPSTTSLIIRPAELSHGPVWLEHTVCLNLNYVNGALV